jgi:hypothetical protein
MSVTYAAATMDRNTGVIATPYAPSHSAAHGSPAS